MAYGMENIANMLARGGMMAGQQIGAPIAQFGQNIGGMLTSGVQKQQKQTDAAEVQKLLEQNKDNPEQLTALYQKYASEGKTDLANLFKQAADAATQKRTAQVASLEQGGAEITAQAQRSRAVQMALQRGDREAAQAIRSGLMDPKEYVDKVAGPREAPKPVTLSAGAALVDPITGKTIAERPFKPQEEKPKENMAFELAKGGKYTPESIQDATMADGSINYSLLVPRSDGSAVSRGNVSSPVETRINKITEESTKASVAMSRNRALQQQLLANPDKSTGIVSQIRTSALDLAGKRDEEEEAKTLFLRTRNTDIINSLPPGVASDTDVRIFSQGFPSENASTEEITRYLQAEERILAASSDMALLADRHLGSQINQGLDATMIGFEDKKQQYGKLMQDMLTRIQQRVANGEDPIVVEQEEVRYISEGLGFTPKFYR
jgi:hypothetical protein